MPHMVMRRGKGPYERFISYTALDIRIFSYVFIVVVFDKFAFEDRPINRKSRYDQKTIYQKRAFLMK